MATYSPGFQGSETSGVRIFIYRLLEDPVVEFRDKRSTVELISPYTDPKVVSVSTSKSMGEVDNPFSIVLKSTEDLTEWFIDADWVDIEFTKHGDIHHVMRGVIDEVRESVMVNKRATDRTFTITGREYGKIWSDTPLFFNKFIGENVVGAAVQKAFSMGGKEVPFGDPRKVVKGMLFNFLRSDAEEIAQVQGVDQDLSLFDEVLKRNITEEQLLADLTSDENTDDTGLVTRQLAEKRIGKASWYLPAMPGIKYGSFFVDNIYYKKPLRMFPERTSPEISLMNIEDGSLWELAKEWSDPHFCELYPDLLDSGTLDYIKSPKDRYRTRMGVILRDKPFMTRHATKGSSSSGSIDNSEWFNLPEASVPEQAISMMNLGRGGTSRLNAFFLAPKLTQELKIDGINLQLPVWDVTDITQRGIRRLDVISPYIVVYENEDGLVGMTQSQRERLVDWYALGPYMYNGTINLSIGMPDIRIGSKLKLVRGFSEDNIIFYVEGVSHSWDLDTGMQTSVTVTHGFKGTDTDRRNAVVEIPNRFRHAIKIKDPKKKK